MKTLKEKVVYLPGYDDGARIPVGHLQFILQIFTDIADFIGEQKHVLMVDAGVIDELANRIVMTMPAPKQYRATVSIPGMDPNGCCSLVFEKVYDLGDLPKLWVATAKEAEKLREKKAAKEAAFALAYKNKKMPKGCSISGAYYLTSDGNETRKVCLVFSDGDQGWVSIAEWRKHASVRVGMVCKGQEFAVFKDMNALVASHRGRCTAAQTNTLYRLVHKNK